MQTTTLLLRTVLCALLLGLISTAGAQSEADYIKLVQAQAAAWSQSVEHLVDTFTDDVIYEDVPLGLVNKGREEMRKFATGFFNAFPDLKSTIVSVVISGDKAAFEWLFEGTQTAELAGPGSTGRRNTGLIS